MPKGADDRYKWMALSNTTLGSLLATIDSSIMLIALPDIFRGIHLDPLLPRNSFYFLWMILSYLVVTSVLVVSLGRLGDMYGRVRMYNLGFVIYTLFSLVLTVTPFTGQVGALWLVVGRIFQGVGAAFLVANSAAILTDAFPENQRGMALGINNIAGISGSFIGLVLGGLLAPINWRLVFLISVPIGLFGTVWAYLRLREVGSHQPRPMDWWGNLTFALGLVAVMIGITYGVQPYRHHTMGWTSPTVLVSLGAGVALLVLFTLIETRVAYPMFRLALFKIRAFTAGTFAAFLAAIGRGGLMFMLIIWLQGIWLPQHGYSFSQTPLWAGIYMLPLTFGFLLAGPASGVLSDRFGARPFATGGMIVAAASFFLLELLPVNFSYILFALLLLLNGLAMGAFASPNRAAVMNSLPARHRGVGSGMSLTFQNSATVLSIGVFFTLMIVGLASTLPASLTHGLAAYHVPARRIHEIAHQPPVSVLFSAFLGFNPVEHLVGAHVIAQIGQVHPASAAALTGRSFFPQLISGPFKHGLSEALDFAVVACLVGAAASWLRGGRYVYVEEESPPVVVPSVPLQPTTDEGVLVQPDGNGRRARGRTRSKAAELDHVARSSSRTPMKPRRW